LTPEPVLLFPDEEAVYKTHYDTLDGKRLHEGDIVLVHWPNGQSEEYTVRIDRKSPPHNYGGVIYQAPDDRAYIEVEHFGLMTRVYLRWEPTLTLEWIAESVE